MPDDEASIVTFAHDQYLLNGDFDLDRDITSIVFSYHELVGDIETALEARRKSELIARLGDIMIIADFARKPPDYSLDTERPIATNIITGLPLNTAQDEFQAAVASHPAAGRHVQSPEDLKREHARFTLERGAQTVFEVYGGVLVPRSEPLPPS